MGLNEIPKYLVIYAWVLCTLAYGVLCFAWVLRKIIIFVDIFMGFTLNDFDCVLHGFYRFVDIGLCVAWVL